MTTPECEQPGDSALHRLPLTWDQRNLDHLRNNCRLSREQVEAGIRGGYIFLREDLKYDCTYQYGFEPLPEIDDAIFVIVVDTSESNLYPITVFELTNVSLKKIYLTKRKKGEIE